MLQLVASVLHVIQQFIEFGYIANPVTISKLVPHVLKLMNGTKDLEFEKQPNKAAVAQEEVSADPACCGYADAFCRKRRLFGRRAKTTSRGRRLVAFDAQTSPWCCFWSKSAPFKSSMRCSTL
jgi:hypothetical protein